MSDLSITAPPTAAELDRALARSLGRGRRLVRRRQQRRAAAGVLGVAVLMGGGFGVLRSLSEDRPSSTTPAGQPGATSSGSTASTTNAPSAPTTTWPSAAGWPTSVTEGGVVSVTNPEPVRDVTVTAPGGVALGGGVITTRGVEAVFEARRLDDGRVLVRFVCQRGADDHVDVVRLRRTGSAVQVDGEVTGVPGDAPCTGAVGASLAVTVPGGPLPADATVTVADLRG